MKLPPMNALRAFEAVSRLGSVSKAAEELCVSQGAVSQQLRNLEDHLGREMFIRTPNSFTLSEEGEAFSVVVQQSLGEIALAARGVARSKIQHTLAISASKGFSVKWLMPNLVVFYESFPDVTVTLDESVKLVTFKNDGIDGAIRSGDGEDGFDGLDSTLLFRPQSFAMASPSYIAEHGKLESLAEPGTHRLIDYLYKSKKIRAQHIHWEDVVSGNLIGPEVQQVTFPDEHQAFNAALQGRGIALVGNYLMEEEIATGKIEYASPEPIQARFSYYFVSPTDARPNNALIGFRDWLVDSLKKYRTQENKGLSNNE